MDISFLNESYTEQTHLMMQGLIKYEDFKNIYSELKAHALEEIAQEYDHVVTLNSNWDSKTTRERIKWKEDFTETYIKLMNLLEEGPLSPESFGFPIQDNNLMNLLRVMGLYEIPKTRETYFNDMLFYESKAQLLNWTIVDSFNHYKGNIESRYSNQPLSKPRDTHAKRALFIKLLSDQNFKTNHITIIARSAFDDELLDDRTVRRLIRGGIDFSNF